MPAAVEPQKWNVFSTLEILQIIDFLCIYFGTTRLLLPVILDQINDNTNILAYLLILYNI